MMAMTTEQLDEREGPMAREAISQCVQGFRCSRKNCRAAVLLKVAKDKASWVVTGLVHATQLAELRLVAGQQKPVGCRCRPGNDKLVVGRGAMLKTGRPSGTSVQLNTNGPELELGTSSPVSVSRTKISNVAAKGICSRRRGSAEVPHDPLQ